MMSLRLLPLLVVAAMAAACASGSGPSAPSPAPDTQTDLATRLDGAPRDLSAPEPWRFAVISDTHLTASPTHPDNQVFAFTGAHLASLDPLVDLVVSTGDNVDDLYLFQEFFNSSETVPVLEMYRDAVDAAFPMPFYAALGNHDVRFFDTWMDATGPAQSWLDAFAGTETFPATYYAVEHRGFQLLVLNSTGGATDYESNDDGALEEAQLQWLDQRLSLGIPAVLFLHHELIPEGPDDDSHPLFPVLAGHAQTIRGVFMGHVHHFDHVERMGIDLWTTGELKGHEGPVYHLVVCDPSDGSVTVEVVDTP